MTRNWPILAALLIATAGACGPAAAQVRVMVDGQLQEVPDGVVRTISYRPGGCQTIHDERFDGPVQPGAATIVTEETIEEDDRGRVIATTVVTRIEPVQAIAFAEAEPPAAEPPAIEPPVAAAPVESAWAEAWPVEAAPVESARVEAAPVATAPVEAASIVPASLIAPAVFEPAEPQRIDARELRIRRDPVTGHFITTIRINGIEVRAIVDTGAASTILSPRDAWATGANGAVVSSQRMIGIGGLTVLNVARVRSLEVAGEQLGGFSAAIGQDGLAYTLLGQTEIARMGRIVIEDGTMTIAPRRAMLASR